MQTSDESLKLWDGMANPQFSWRQIIVDWQKQYKIWGFLDVVCYFTTGPPLSGIERNMQLSAINRNFSFAAWILNAVYSQILGWDYNGGFVVINNDCVL